MKWKLRKCAAIIFTAVLAFSTVGNSVITVHAAEEGIVDDGAAAAAAAQAEAERIAAEQAAAQAAAEEAARIAAEQAAAQAAAEAAAKAAAEQAAAEAAAKAAAEAAAAEAAAKAAAEQAAQEAAAKAKADAEQAAKDAAGEAGADAGSSKTENVTTDEKNGEASGNTEQKDGEQKDAEKKDGASEEIKDGEQKTETDASAEKTDEADKEAEKEAEAEEDADAEEEEEEEEEEEVKYPAASWSGETSDLRVSASVGEGVFPEGTEMKVAAVSKSQAVSAAQHMTGENTGIVDAVAADITFWYEGREIQPQGAVSVRLFAKRAVQGENHNAVTIDDHGNAAPVAGASARSSSFDTNHFTVYGIVGTSYEDKDMAQYVRHTYEFYVGDYESPLENAVKVDTLIVKNGDTLTVPADPAGDAKHTFAGWFAADAEGKLTDNKVGGTVTINPATLTGDVAKEGSTGETQKTIKVYAKFNRKYTITLYGDAEQSIVYDTIVAEDRKEEELPTPETATTNGLAVPAGQKMTGWKNVDDEGSQVTDENKIKVNGADIKLVPEFAAAHTVHFNKVKTVFDDYAVPDQAVLDGDKVTQPAIFTEEEVYKGYKFDGWYTVNPDENDVTDEQKYNFDTKLGTGHDQEFTLYAKWIPQELNIRVEVYQENANDTGYTRLAPDTDSFKAEADGEIPLAKILEKYHDEKYPYFHLNGTKDYEENPTDIETKLSDNRKAIEISDNTGTDEYSVDEAAGCKKTVNPDGSTVVRIYYSRDTYNLAFAFYNTGGNITNVNGSRTLNENGMQYAPDSYRNTPLPTLRIKYGQHLYKRTHDFSDGQGDMFDAFLKKSPWYFEKIGMDSSGQAVFDESNKSFPVKPKTNIGDGGALEIRVYLNGEQKNYPIVRRYYTEQWTQADILQGNAGKYRSEETKIVYTKDHPHQYEIGSASNGYKLVAATNYEQVQLKSAGAYQGYQRSGLPDGTHRFKWINGKTLNNECEPIILHYVPVSYSVTFRQTKIPGTVNNGRRVPEDSKVDEIVFDGISFGQTINLAQMLSERNDDLQKEGWSVLKDANGVVYSALDGWKGGADGNGTFPATMPAQNLVFYKEWVCDTYTVTVDWNYTVPTGTDKVFTQKDIPYGDAVKNPAEEKENKTAANRENYVLTGWKAYPGTSDGKKASDTVRYESYSFNTPVTENLYIEAQWASVGGYKVTYDAGAHGKVKGEKTFDDPQKYASNAKAPVKYTAVPEEEYVFTGWAIGGVIAKEPGTAEKPAVYYGSGDVITSSETFDAAGETDPEKQKDSIIRLVAQYEKKVPTTSVTYHSHYPDGTPDRDVVVEADKYLAINGDYTILNVTHDELAFSPNDKSWEFLYWTTKEDGTGERFYPEEVAAAGQEKNDLYAQWIRIQIDTINVVKVWNDNNNPARPASVTVRLYADGKPAVNMDGDAVGERILNTDSNWSGSWSKLPEKNSSSGAKIVYTVTEEAVAGYTVNYTSATSGGILTFTVTNTLPPVGGGGDTPPTPPTPPVPPLPDPGDPEDIPAPLPDPEVPDVLGVARRTTAMDAISARVRNYDEPDVLGSRRGKTGETSDADKAMVILAAGMMAVALTKDKKKRMQ